jgi:hypothetical protein
MIRRTKHGEGVNSPEPLSGGGGASATASSKIATPSIPSSSVVMQRTHSHPRRSPDSSSSKLSPAMLLTIVCASLFGFLVVLSYLSPSSVMKAESTLYQAEQQLQLGLGFGGGTHERVVPPRVQEDPLPRQRSLDATEAMLKHDSSWVDGEKKLKKELKKLAERQAQGKDLGVPVLTRWLGEDIPAWAGEGIDLDDWKNKVDQRYADMRDEEMTWRAKMAGLLDK